MGLAERIAQAQAEARAKKQAAALEEEQRKIEAAQAEAISYDKKRNFLGKWYPDLVRIGARQFLEEIALMHPIHKKGASVDKTPLIFLGEELIKQALAEERIRSGGGNTDRVDKVCPDYLDLGVHWNELTATGEYDHSNAPDGGYYPRYYMKDYRIGVVLQVQDENTASIFEYYLDKFSNIGEHRIIELRHRTSDYSPYQNYTTEKRLLTFGQSDQEELERSLSHMCVKLNITPEP